MGYEFIGKEIHRATIAVCYAQTPTLPILYLDGEEGEATASFLRSGVPRTRLEPINLDPQVIARIDATHKVKGTVGNIDDIVFARARDSYSVVWLDYMCRFEEWHLTIFRQSLRIAPFVCVTFSTRAIDKAPLFDGLLSRVKGMSHVVERPYPYKGKSDYENMVKFSLARKQRDTGSPDADDWVSDSSSTTDSSSCATDERDVGRGGVDVGAKVLVDWRGTWLTAKVKDATAEQFLVCYDYDGVEKWTSKSKVLPNVNTLDPTTFVGKEVGIPVRLWENGVSGYEDIKRKRKKLFFKVGPPYRRGQNKDRLNVYGVRKDGKICKQAEYFTITAEQAKCWMMEGK